MVLNCRFIRVLLVRRAYKLLLFIACHQHDAFDSEEVVALFIVGTAVASDSDYTYMWISF